MGNSTTMKTTTLVALDIGTTKVCAVAGRLNEFGKLEILGFNTTPSTGVLRGIVSNIDKTVNAIATSTSLVSKVSDIDVKSVLVGISGQHIKSFPQHNTMTRVDQLSEISEKDIDELIKDMHRLRLEPGEKILHVLPQQFTVDNEQGILDPIGMSGIRLEADFYIITGQLPASNNLRRCVEKVGLDVASITLEQIASANAVLSEAEKNAGVVLVDIGGGTTDITIYLDGIIRHTGMIPFGGNVITKDIKEGCRVMEDKAEKLKVRFGSALPEKIVEDRMITITSLKGHEPKEISERNLARIIRARTEEILDYVMLEINKSGLTNKLIGGIVLTGGGANLNHIEKLTALYTGMNTRVGLPTEYLGHGYPKRLASPEYSTAIGLLLNGLQTQPLQDEKAMEEAKLQQVVDEVSEEIAKEEVGFVQKLTNGIKSFFEAEPDTDF